MNRAGKGGGKSDGRGLRRLLVVLLWIGLIALVASQFTSGQQLLALIDRVDWGWAAASVAVHLVYFVVYTNLYVIAYRAIGIRGTLSGLVPILFASYFLKAVVPIHGAGSVAVFIEDAIERGQSGAKAAAATVIVLLADLASVTPVIALGFYFLWQAHRLEFWELLALISFLVFVGLLVIGMWLAANREELLNDALGAIRSAINRLAGLFRRPELVGADWPRRNTDQLAQAARAIGADRRAVLQLLALGISLHILNIFGLALILLAFGIAPTLPLLMAGFGINVVVFVISIIPEGIGAVEGAMSVVFAALGLARQTAIAVTLGFRLLNVWLPVSIGFFTIQSLTIVSGRRRGE